MAEKLGYYGFYYGESLADLDLDCWTVLSSLSSITKQIKLDPVITYLFPQYSPKEKERVSILEEDLQVLQMLWNKSTVRFNGKFFKVNDATLQHPSKYIPIIIAAKRKKMMSIAARFADIWEASYLSPEKFHKLNLDFDNAFKEFNRTVSKSIELDVIIADSDSDLNYKEKIFAMERGPSVFNQILRNGLVGKPEDIAERVKEYVHAGVEQFFLAFQDPFDSKALELFMDVVK